ncbi:MAG: hypothetical protein ACXVAX_13130, partial [Pseudobdellovibrio sp.]
MKKALIFSLLPLLFSCAIVSKHGDQTNAEPTPTESKTPVAATPAPATPAPTVKSLTKTITD